jgi:hypothetical protein
VLKSLQESLSIDESADAILANLEKPNARLCQSFLLERIRQKEPGFSVSSTGRVFNGLTGLARPLREAVRLAGEPMAGVDIRCAQPALLTLLMGICDPKNVPRYKRMMLESLSHWSSLVPRPVSARLLLACSFLSEPLCVGADSSVFRDLVFSGGLYEQLIGLCTAGGIPLGDDPRDTVKLLLVRDVLAKRGHYPSEFERVFRMAFPSVYRFIRRFNARDHSTLICSLQRLESWLVIENVAPRLVEKIPFLSLHDAIYARAVDVSTVVAAFEETFDRLGFRLRLKEEKTQYDH